ncbi:AAA family ATPase [Parvibacter caecicola]|uniref:Putative transcriptional regulator/adenylate kinase n=1 Tax=Parvibacter caecicola TaxID=747645 RepID=A0A7W5D204_9ACTN|nr:AAA family ATPase [Parvibacter caecicola]MBB3171230.1 putative transcriptional regulator/adenylate kinase [Parvibacter caecicola]MCR2041979.1 AAA family ATPase [Parvibacter caecicola]RNL09814.1 hypothetical protein DMP11_08100 [Parvibacter caecicola]
MTNAAVISIYSVHAKKIYAGKKKYEFRTRKPARPIDYLALYETLPAKAVTGFARVVSILEGSPDDIWKETRDDAGISYEYFEEYFKGKSKAVAYRLDSPEPLTEEVPLQELGVERPPQSFQYLSDEASRRLLSLGDTKSKSRVFIGGVHGVGKTTLAERLAVDLGCSAYSSSALISDWKSKPSADLCSNQDVLIKALKATNWFTEGGILDGHFVLRRGDGSFFQVPEGVFEQMDLSSMLLMVDEPGRIVERLIARDGLGGVSHDALLGLVSELQEVEQACAQKISGIVGVPLQVAKSTDSADDLLG